MKYVTSSSQLGSTVSQKQLSYDNKPDDDEVVHDPCD